MERLPVVRECGAVLGHGPYRSVRTRRALLGRIPFVGLGWLPVVVGVFLQFFLFSQLVLSQCGRALHSVVCEMEMPLWSCQEKGGHTDTRRDGHRPHLLFLEELRSAKWAIRWHLEGPPQSEWHPGPIDGAQVEAVATWPWISQLVGSQRVSSDEGLKQQKMRRAQHK